MKSRLKIFFAVVVFGLFSIYGNAQSLANQLENSQEVEFVRPGQFSELPAYIKFKKGHELSLDQFQTWLKSNLKLAPEMGFKLVRKESDNLGQIHYRYQQTFNGFPLEDAIWIAHTNGDKVHSCNGLIYKNLQTVITPNLTEEGALSKALEKINAETYKWQMPGEEAHLRWETGDQTATYFPKAELVYVATSKNFEAGSYRLVYKFNIYAHKPLYRADVYVDANSGEIIRENLLIHHADTPGTAHTAYSGAQPIIADSFEGTYRLRDASRGNGVRTFDLKQGYEYGSALDFIDPDNDWNNINPEQDEYATDAHWGTEMTYDYYFEYYGRSSIDNEGFQLNSYVHYGMGFFNAFWDGDRMTYGDGDGMPSTPLTTMDIVGHEITHGLTEKTANLIYSEESGALNESFSDIFGTAIEEYAKPGEWDWIIGFEIGAPFRSMSNPNLFDCPDTYQGDFWLDGADVHINSGVQNHWYYLLTEGGAGTNDIGDVYEVVGIGVDDASAIAFRNLTVYLTPSSNYADARFYSILAAEDLFGGCSFNAEQTTNAWYAVGVGDPYSFDVVADFTAAIALSCTIPFDAVFENLSVNGAEFFWDFGDGTTSTDENPVHTYTEEGLYDVNLIVTNELCAGDTESEIMKEGFINVDLEAPCPYLFPHEGEGEVLTFCNGLLFDSGGPEAPYGLDEFVYQTISPTDAIAVQLKFLSFGVEGNDEFDEGCYYDYLVIYDGPDYLSPTIGYYCNVSPPPAIITSSGPSISFYFEAVGYEFGNPNFGFEIEWTCIKEVDETGINPNNETDLISIYPNPTDNFVTIESRLSQNGTIEVRDVLGRKLFSVLLTNQFTQIDLARYEAKGLYFIHVIDEKGETLAIEKVILN